MSLAVRDNITPGIARLAGRISDPRPILEVMGTALQSTTHGAWNNQAWRASEWAPLKPATLRAKQRERKSTAILKRAPLLWRSFRVELATDAVIVGTDRPYAAVHQLGSRKKNIPARPMLPFDANKEMADFARRRVDAAARKQIRLMMQGL